MGVERDKQGSRAPDVAPHQRARVEAAMTYLRKHFRNAPRLRDVARAAHFSPYHFHRIFRQHFGKTFKMAATELQMDEAQRLLLEGHSATSVGKAVGFAKQASFNHRFKKCFGLSPQQWLATQGEKPPSKC